MNESQIDIENQAILSLATNQLVRALNIQLQCLLNTLEKHNPEVYKDFKKEFTDKINSDNDFNDNKANIERLSALKSILDLIDSSNKK